MNPQTNMGQNAQDAASQVADQARQKSTEVMQQAQDTARTTLSQQKGRAAESVSTVADALRKSSSHLNNNDQAAIGHVADQLASRLDQFSDDLQNKSVDQMFGDVQDFARRDPQLFLGGAVVLGLLAARFLKASGQRMQQQQMGSWNQYDYNQQSRLRSYPRQGLTDYRSGTFQGEHVESFPNEDYGTSETGSGTGTTYSTGNQTSTYETGTQSGTYSSSQRRTDSPDYNAEDRFDEGSSGRTNE